MTFVQMILGYAAIIGAVILFGGSYFAFRHWRSTTEVWCRRLGIILLPIIVGSIVFLIRLAIRKIGLQSVGIVSVISFGTMLAVWFHSDDHETHQSEPP